MDIQITCLFLFEPAGYNNYQKRQSQDGGTGGSPRSQRHNFQAQQQQGGGRLSPQQQNQNQQQNSPGAQQYQQQKKPSMFCIEILRASSFVHKQLYKAQSQSVCCLWIQILKQYFSMVGKK